MLFFFKTFYKTFQANYFLCMMWHSAQPLSASCKRQHICVLCITNFAPYGVHCTLKKIALWGARELLVTTHLRKGLFWWFSYLYIFAPRIVHYVPVTSGNNAIAVRLIVVHLAMATPLICHRLVEGADDNMSHSNQRPFALSSLLAWCICTL